jgi:hypothetical protein
MDARLNHKSQGRCRRRGIETGFLEKFAGDHGAGAHAGGGLLFESGCSHHVHFNL